MPVPSALSPRGRTLSVFPPHVPESSDESLNFSVELMVRRQEYFTATQWKA